MSVGVAVRQQGHLLSLLRNIVFFPLQLREIASHLVQLQEALNELSEEHNAALTQAQEKQGQLESELQTALHEKVRGSRWVPCSAAPTASQAGGHVLAAVPAARREALRQSSVLMKPGVPSPHVMLCSSSLSPEMLGRDGRDSAGEDFSAGRPNGQTGGLQHPGEGRGHGGRPEGTAGSAGSR